MGTRTGPPSRFRGLARDQEASQNNSPAASPVQLFPKCDKANQIHGGHRRSLPQLPGNSDPGPLTSLRRDRRFTAAPQSKDFTERLPSVTPESAQALLDEAEGNSEKAVELFFFLQEGVTVS